MTRVAAALGWRRAVAHRLVLLAVFLTVLLTTTLLAMTSLYAGSVTESGLRGALTGAPVGDRTMHISVSVDDRADFEGRDDRVRTALDAAFDVVPLDVYGSATSASYGFRGVAGRTDEDLTVFAFYDELRDHASLVRGDWPAESPDGLVQVALPDPAARRLDLQPGDTIALDNRLTAATVETEVAGTFAADRSDKTFWLGDDLAVDGVEAGSSFTTYGPLVVPRTTFLDRFAVDATAVWRAVPHFDDVTTDDLAVLQDDVPALGDAADPGTLGADVLVDSGVEGLVEEMSTPLLVLRSTITVPTALLVLLAFSTLLLSMRLLSDHRAAEVELLRSRGMSSGQLVAHTLREALALTLPAALLAPWLAALLLRAADGVGPFADDPLAATVRPGAADWWVTAGAALVGCAILVVGAWSQGRDVVAERQARGRPARTSALQRAGGDVVLAGLAGLAYWQLTRYGSTVVTDASGRLAVDPLLVLAPTVLLLAGAVLVLRLVPLLARGADRLVERTRSALVALGIWQLTRRTRQQTGPAMLLALATAIGVFSLTFADAWSHSQQDQADFTTGADVRLTSVPGTATANGLGDLAGVDAVTPVLRSSSSFGSVEAEVLGVDADTAGDVMVLRPDLTGRPLAELTDALARGRPDDPVLAIPAEAETVVLPLSVIADDPARAAADIFAVVRDDTGVLHRVPLQALPADGRERELRVDLGPLPAAVGLLAVEVRPAAAADNTLRIRLETPRAEGPGGEDLGALDVPPGSLWQLDFAGTGQIAPRGDVVDPEAGGGAVEAWMTAGCCAPVTFSLLLTSVDATQAPPPLPALVSSELAGAVGDADTFVLQAGGAVVPLQVEAVLDGVPTVDPAEAAGVVVDLTSFSDVVYRQTRDVATPNEWWLSTGHDAADDTMAALRSDDDLAGAVALERDADGSGPDGTAVGAGVASALDLGALAAAAFATAGFALGAVISVRARRGEQSVLRAVGLGRRSAARPLVIEHAVVVVLGVGVGVLVGSVVAWLVVPLVTLTPAATEPFPSVLVELPWQPLAAFAVAVVAVAALVIGLVSRQGAGSRPADRLREEG